MREYIIRRLLLIAPIMLGVSFLTYATVSIIPGAAAGLICQFNCTPETLKDIRQELGLDRPFYEQYGDWLAGIFQGDLGEAFFTHLPGTTGLGRGLPGTRE